ncbi:MULTISPECIES: ExbD/TolR family protein [unclassified Coleofasciculus]|uniref:ExbD/TolR family protein n=1 Tax=unclassified Coleofasciculus TaxID=2692782 RepID=UPI00187FCAC3|nr:MULTISPECIES: biopolymer transporter ExbD [unclassified Coleofasciculus]MBE9126604.1 biopolymer transporter ExbD [Coleofasciculus sp. LEGE 07081]MBE9148856.1 biopolymer transporter ExbD [Coleofasciculus sp. LEGE 07092]
MRFRNRQPGSSIPEVNLVPMMDVLMSVLTFFIIISMGFTTQITADVELPEAGPAKVSENGAGARAEKTPDPLIIGLNAQNQILLANKPVNKEQMGEAILSYLTEKPDGVVVLKADRKLSYKQVEQILGEMQKIGGDRVSLALQ